MSRDRGLRLQNALAAYLTRWWPSAESAGAGRKGTDVLGVPGVVWENKTADEFRPLEFVRQAQGHAQRSNSRKPGTALCSPADEAIPVAVYWPRGTGKESADVTIAMLPLGVLVRLLREAGY